MSTRHLFGAIFLSAAAALAPLSTCLPGAAQISAAMMPPSQSRTLPRSRFSGDGSGALQVLSKDGKSLQCPLKHTTVQASVSGYMSRVTVKQLFGNPFKDKIEAVYTFPLTDTGAVDDMVMRVGQRTIHGTIKKREEARQIYDDAKRHGQVAALLDQERPNIFTQSVANIEPGKDVEVTLTYVDLLPYQNGSYSFAFPTVVGPRFNPGAPTGKSGLGFSPDTTSVPDASKITPHVAPQGVRAGHDISINVSIDAGVPIGEIQSQLHEINVNRSGNARAMVSLKDKDSIPNKDFVLTWAIAADQVKSGYLTNGHDGAGYFTVMIMPPKRPSATDIQPKEMIFLIDCSGSQSGKPIEKAQEAMEYALDHMNAHDTFQILTFNNSVTRLFERPREATPEMRKVAKEFVHQIAANGGTWMAPAVEAVCKEPTDEHRLRIVTFMTDGYVGNDMEIVGMVKKLRGTSRWFPFGTGNSVNRFLIDNIAKAGGGEADYVYLNSNAAEVGKKFYDKISSPVLTDVKVDFGGLAVKEVFPHELSDVWAQHPLYITGRYTKPGAGTVTISGFTGGKPYKQTLAMELPQNNASNVVLGSLWARAKVDRLMDEDWMGAQTGNINKELRDEIVKVALEHHIMTQYTSFVAVEEKMITKGGEARTVEVPVEMPDGVSREGVFGAEEKGVSRAGGVIGAGGGAATGMTSGAMRVRSFNGPMVARKAAAPMSPQQINSVGAMAAPPPPLPTGAPMSIAAKPASAMVAGKVMAQSYNSRSIGDSKDADSIASITLSKSEREKALPKLSEALRRLVDNKDKQGAEVYIRVKVKNPGQDVLYTLMSWMQIEATVFGDKTVIGKCAVAQLLGLASDSNVISVEQVHK